MFLIGAAWAVAAPYDGTPDERDHILRAYGVATGQILLKPEKAALGGGGFVDAPRSLDVDRCWQFEPEHNASCSGEPGTDRRRAPTATSAGRNAPLYYALVGLPLALSPDWTGVILARLICALICAALLANALADALQWGRHRLMAAGVLVATTPMVLHLAGAVNPSAVELAGAIALFAAAVPLLSRPGQAPVGRDQRLLRHLGIAGLAMATTRLLGPLWLLLALLVLLLPWRRSRLRDLWVWDAARRWVYALAVAGIAGVLWTLVSGGSEPNSYFRSGEPVSALHIVWRELQTWPRYVDEMVGVTSWLDARMPELAYVVWPTVGGALVLWGYVSADRIGRVRLAVLGAVAVAAPLAIAVAYVNTFGFITQGRYLLPLLVGLPILATFLLGEHDGVSEDRARTLRRLTVAVLLPIHLLALLFTMQRWQIGQGQNMGLDLLHSPWRPPLGPLVPLAAAVCGTVLLGGLAWGRRRVNASERGRRRGPRTPPAPATEPPTAMIA